jgi:hypothetical protein
LRKIRLSLTGAMLIIGAAIFIGYLYFVGFWQVLGIIRSLDIRYFLLAILIALLSIVLYALSWKILIVKPGLKFSHSIEIVLVSIFTDLAIPTAGISAEIIRISMTNKKGKIPLGDATASVLIHRLLLVTTFGIVLGVSLVALVLSSTAKLAQFYLFLTLAILFLALGVIGIYVSFNAHRFARFVDTFAVKVFWLVKRFRPKYEIQDFRSDAIEGYERFTNAIKGIGRGTFLASSLMLVAMWLILAFIPYFMFISLNHPEPYLVILSVSVFVSMVQTIPIGIPGLVGVIEVSMTAFFIGFGVPAAIAASATILTRLVTFWFELFIGAVAASLQGVRGSQFKVRENEEQQNPKPTQ